MIIKTALRGLWRHASPDVVEVAGSIDEEVNRINHVVTDVLDFARPIRFSLQTADLVQICREAAQAVTSEAEDVPVAFEPSDAEAPVVTDIERLRGVLVNVLTNAQHAVRARGIDGQAPPPVHIQTNRAGGHRWQIEVRDRGIGIAAGRSAARLRAVFHHAPHRLRPRTGPRPQYYRRASAARLPWKARSMPARPCASSLPETSQQSPRPL